MGRNTKPINIVMHRPDDDASLEALQRITDELYAHMIADRLSSSNLTPDEAEYIAKQVIASLAI